MHVFAIGLLRSITWQIEKEKAYEKNTLRRTKKAFIIYAAKMEKIPLDRSRYSTLAKADVVAGNL